MLIISFDLGSSNLKHVLQLRECALELIHVQIHNKPWITSDRDCRIKLILYSWFMTEPNWDNFSIWLIIFSTWALTKNLLLFFFDIIAWKSLIFFTPNLFMPFCYFVNLGDIIASMINIVILLSSLCLL